MEAKKCDRCGKLYEYTPLSEKVSASSSVILRTCCMDGIERAAIEWDLCHECNEDFERWIMAGRAKEAKQIINIGEKWKQIETGAICEIKSLTAGSGNCIAAEFNSGTTVYSPEYFFGHFVKEETTPAEAEEAEAQRVRVGEYWQNNETGVIVKITDADEIEVHFKGISSGHYFREGADYFKKTYTKKGGAE